MMPVAGNTMNSLFAAYAGIVPAFCRVVIAPRRSASVSLVFDVVAEAEALTVARITPYWRVKGDRPAGAPEPVMKPAMPFRKLCWVFLAAVVQLPKKMG